MPNQIVWCDIPVVDLERAIRFYSAVLDSPVKKEQFPGVTIGIFPHNDGEVGACLFKAEDEKPSDKGLTIYLNAKRSFGRGYRRGRAERREGIAAEGTNRSVWFQSGDTRQ